jgi:hypothetical protein
VVVIKAVGPAAEIQAVDVIWQLRAVRGAVRRVAGRRRACPTVVVPDRFVPVQARRAVSPSYVHLQAPVPREDDQHVGPADHPAVIDLIRLARRP